MAVTDLGQTELKNIERPIRVYSLQVGVRRPSDTPAIEAKAREPKQAASRARSPVIVALIVLAADALVFPRREPARRRRASCHHRADVHEWLSNDPAQDYIADWITENLTTELSRMHDRFVDRAQHALLRTRAGRSTPRRSSSELGVRYRARRLGAARPELGCASMRNCIDARIAERISGPSGFEEDVDRPVQAAGSGGRAISQLVWVIELVKAEAEAAHARTIPTRYDLVDARSGEQRLQSAVCLQQGQQRCVAGVATNKRSRSTRINAMAIAGRCLSHYLHGVHRLDTDEFPQTDYDAKILGAGRQSDHALAPR